MTLAPGEFLLVWASGKDRAGAVLHTNFKLGAGGEFLGLYTADGTLVDAFNFGAQETDISSARFPDGTGGFQTTSKPTPGAPNQSGPAADPLTISPGSQFFNGSLTVTLASGVDGVQIRYTLDGSTVTTSSQLYNSAIILSSTTVLRARTFKDSAPASEDISQFYVRNYPGHLPVLSLATAESNLYGSSGIFDNSKKEGDNWEREVSVNLLELDGSGFQINCGIRVHGQHSRTYPKKSVRLHFRSEYGAGRLNYKLFSQKALTSFNTLVIHSGGSFDQYFENDKWTLLRDPLNHALWLEKDGAVSVFRPVILYINGELWGVYHIRERINDDYVIDNFKLANAPDVLEWTHKETPEVKDGDLVEWNKMYPFIKNNSLKSSANYAKAKSMINIDNFIDYNIIEIYGGHKDWPHNNVFFFRERVADAKWHWILWDSETTYRNPDIKLLEWATRDRVRTDISRNDSESQLFGTIFLRRFLENAEFKELFINRFADFLNTNLAADHVRSMFEELAANIEADIPIEANRWGVPVSQWQNGLAQVRDFITRRTNIQRNQVVTYFKLGGKALLTVKTTGGGRIRVNSLTPNLPWSGTYFMGNSVTLEAIPDPGYRFVSWSGATLPNSSVVKLNLTGDRAITANFAASAPFVRVLTPNGSEQLTVAQSYDITWTSDQIGSSVRIEFSTNNGASWTVIEASTANDGRHTWTIPNSPSTQCLVRISKSDTGNPSDTSDGVFTIKTADVPSLPVIASFQPATGPVGTPVTIAGSNFTGATVVKFNNAAAVFSVTSASQVLATVPTGATSGKISVTTPAGTATSAADFVVTSGGGQTLTFTPAHDAFVWSSKPSNNYGSSSDLRVRKTSELQIAYLKFDVSGLSGSVTSAKLRLVCSDASNNGGAIYTVSNNFLNSSNPWTEGALLWTNAPAVSGSSLSSVGAVSVGQTFEWDVTAAISGNGIFSFAIKNTSTDAAYYSSKEGTQTPQLVISNGRVSIAKITDGEFDEFAGRAANPVIPETLTLLPNYPNPFNAETTFEYGLPEATQVQLVIYNLRGQEVRVLVNEYQHAGFNTVQWDGRDDAGQAVSSGLYITRLIAGGKSVDRKLLLQK